MHRYAATVGLTVLRPHPGVWVLRVFIYLYIYRVFYLTVYHEGQFIRGTYNQVDCLSRILDLQHFNVYMEFQD